MGDIKWIENDLICLIDSEAFGISLKGDTFRIGKAEHVQAYLRGDNLDETIGTDAAAQLGRNLDRAGVPRNLSPEERASRKPTRARATILRRQLNDPIVRGRVGRGVARAASVSTRRTP